MNKARAGSTYKIKQSPLVRFGYPVFVLLIGLPTQKKGAETIDDMAGDFIYVDSPLSRTSRQVEREKIEEVCPRQSCPCREISGVSYDRRTKKKSGQSLDVRKDCFSNICSCLEGESKVGGDRHLTRVGSYELLDPDFESSGGGTGDGGTRKRQMEGAEEAAGQKNGGQEEVRFYNEDRSWTSVVVGQNLRTIDLCDLLKIRRNVAGNAWSVTETWPELGIARTLEDHEDVLTVYREMESFAARHKRQFFFRQDPLKYEYFVNPKIFFPSDMLAIPHGEGRDEGLIKLKAVSTNGLTTDNSDCPQIHGWAWIRQQDSNVWRKTRVLLRGPVLYATKKGNQQPEQLARLSDYQVYGIGNARRWFGAPFEWGACLSPSRSTETTDGPKETGEPGLKVIVFHNEESRARWLTAMRLAKYGKQLRENYRAFKNKQCEQGGGGSPKEQYGSYNVSNESVRSRVAMDFTGSVGRIVEDPKEARDIAENEGIIWRRRWRPFSRPPPGCAVVRLHGLDGGIHVLQPWFHGDLKREIAAAIIRDHGSVDGVFLVRESKSNPGAYVLTYKYSEKIFHAQIQPVFDERRNCWLYTLDKGVTKFYDLLQLIEFYQLNAGSLPTRLTHYVQNGIPTPRLRPEDGGASPSPPDTAAGHQLRAPCRPTDGAGMEATEI